ncbi:hypothetical protein EON66_03555 [archaeon]|nr:MAG: hypothetical protein EON66_03555 [archaeon]
MRALLKSWPPVQEALTAAEWGWCGAKGGREKVNMSNASARGGSPMLPSGRALITTNDVLPAAAGCSAASALGVGAGSSEKWRGAHLKMELLLLSEQRTHFQHVVPRPPLLPVWLEKIEDWYIPCGGGIGSFPRRQHGCVSWQTQRPRDCTHR